MSDGKSRPQTARIKLCSESLVLQREEFIFPDDDDGGYPVDNKVTHKLLYRPTLYFMLPHLIIKFNY